MSKADYPNWWRKSKEVHYILCRPDLREGPKVNISQSEFESYKEAKTILENCLALEEKHDILLSNYIDLERQIFDITTSYVVRGFSGLPSFFNAKLSLNRRLVNLLTAARLYTDRVCSHAQHCTPDDLTIKKKVRSYLSEEYDRKLEYRVMEQLRNYVQHYNLPIHWIGHHNRVVDQDDSRQVEASLEFSIEKTHLEQYESIKPNVLHEMPEKMDLKLTTRCYIESFREVHRKSRELIKDAVEKSRDLVLTCLVSYGTQLNKEVSSLNAVKLTDSGREIEEVLLFLGWDDQRIELQNKNKSLRNIEKTIVTTKTVNVS